MGYCTWAGMNETHKIYHDTEWGIPEHDDRHMFEHLTLECLQCGLSWDLMLKKREIFRQCFDNFVRFMAPHNKFILLTLVLAHDYPISHTITA